MPSRLSAPVELGQEHAASCLDIGTAIDDRQGGKARRRPLGTTDRDGARQFHHR